MEERRQGSTIRRQINELDWTDVGRALAVWLVLHHAESILNHWDSLAILFVVIIAPKYIGRIVYSRFNGGQSQNYERKESTVTRTTTKPDNPTQGIVG